MYILRLRIKTNILNVFIAILNNFISNRQLLIVLLFLKDTRILILWITVYLCLFVSSIQSKSFFIHSSVVNGKKKIVATEVNSTASSFGSTRPKTAAEPNSGKFEIPLSSADQEWLGSLLYHPNESDIRLRKEYRQLSEKERGDLNVAFNLLKNDTVRVIIYIFIYTMFHIQSTWMSFVKRHVTKEAKGHSLWKYSQETFRTDQMVFGCHLNMVQSPTIRTRVLVVVNFFIFIIRYCNCLKLNYCNHILCTYMSLG